MKSVKNYLPAQKGVIRILYTDDSTTCKDDLKSENPSYCAQWSLLVNER